MRPAFPYSLLATVAILAFLCAHLTHVLSRRTGLVDRPDARKLHDGHIPMAGGPMVFVTFLIAAMLFDMPALSLDGAVVWLALLSVIFVVGLLDDYVHLPPALRLFVQAICGLMMPVMANVVLIDLRDLLGFGPILLGYLAIPLTALAFAGLVNAYNMIDGADGLCASLALLPLLVIAVLAWQGAHPAADTLFVIVTALAVFLLFNLSPGTWLRPKVFLGDSGSGLLGFVVCSVMVYLSQQPQMLVKPVTCLWLVGVPLIDMIATMLVRLRDGHHPMRADRRHLHHILIDCGFSPVGMRRTVVSYAVVLAAVGLLLMPQRSYVSLGAFFAVFAAHLVFVKFARRVIRHALPSELVNEGA